jgi:hypothetical protein
MLNSGKNDRNNLLIFFLWNPSAKRKENKRYEERGIGSN